MFEKAFSLFRPAVSAAGNKLKNFKNSWAEFFRPTIALFNTLLSL